MTYKERYLVAPGKTVEGSPYSDEEKETLRNLMDAALEAEETIPLDELEYYSRRLTNAPHSE